MAKKMKRVLSLVLIFSLLMSMLSISAYATDGTGEGQPAAPLNQQQVVTSQKDVFVNGQKVSISKSLEGTNIENVFDITLQVNTESVIQELYEDPDIAVAIVMDISGSMCLLPENNLGQQYLDAVAAAKSFINTFCTNAQGKNAIRDLALVTFNTDAAVQQPLTDCTKAGVSFKEAFDDIDQAVKYANGVFDDSYRRSSSDRFTNIEAGLRLGQNVLNTTKAENKFMILLTDGFPTTYYAGHNSSSTTTIAGYNPYKSIGTVGDDGYFYDALTDKVCSLGTSYSDKAALYAKNAAAAVKADGITLFTVGVNIGGQNISTMVRNSSYSVVDCFINPNYKGAEGVVFNADGRVASGDTSVYEVGNNKGAYETWLKNNISSTPAYYSNGDNLQGLLAAYSDFLDTINTTIENASKAKWVVSDPMGDDVEFLKFFDKDGDLKTSLTGEAVLNGENEAVYSNGIDWDIKESGYTAETKNNVTTYTYTLKYRVRLQNEVNGFEEETSVATNGTTKLGYQWKETVNGVDKFQDKPDLEFPIPAVEGYLGELTFQKTACGEPMNGAEFTLTHNDNCSVCAAMGVKAVIAPMVAVSSGTVEGEAGQTPEGKVSFENIPSGHEYTLSETKAPEGYEPTADRQVVVAYDVTTVDGTSDFTAIDNKPLNSLVITKDVNLKTDGDKNTEKEEELISAATYTIKVEKVGDDDWSRTVTLPMDKDGQKVWSAKLEGLTSGEYTVTELGGNVLEGYNYSQTIKVNDIIIKDKKETETESVTVSLADGMTGQADVVNNYEYEQKMIPVTAYKVWDDADNQDGKRPDSVRFELSVGGVVLDEKDGPQKDVTDSCTMEVTDPATKEPVQKIDPNKFSVTFEYDANQYPGTPSVREVGYTVNGTYYPFTDQVTAVPGYDKPAVNGLTITNKHVPETIDIPVTKKWVDADNQDGIRPANVKINLYADKVLVDTAEVSSSHTFKDLPKYKNGEIIEYEIDEVEVPNGYTKKVEGFTVTNTHKPAEQTVTVTKVWDDANNQDGKRPESITVKLYADGVEVDSHVLTGEGNNWSYTFTGLPMYKEGKKIVYTVDEEVVPADYTKDVDGNVITNSHTPETTDVKVSKVWAGRKMEDSVTIRLLADGNEVDNIVLTAENEWIHTFTDLPKYSAGKLISYTVTEDPLGSFWSADIKQVDGEWVVTNSYYVPSPPTIDVSVKKVWDDADDADGLRPESITVQLLRNGKVYAEEELSEGNWSTTWTDLYANDTWTVKEVNVPEGYTSSVSGSGTSFTITNTHTPETPVITPEEPTPPTGGKDPEDPLHGLDDGDVPQDYMEVGDPDVPKTGDTTNVMLWLTVAFLSAAALLGMRFAERKIK